MTSRDETGIITFAVKQHNQISGFDLGNYVEMSRSWSSAHDWKSCIPQKGIESSNLSISAKNPAILSDRGISFLLPLFVHFSPAGTAQKIVYADLIKVSQSAENMRRNHPLPAFVVGVCPLRDVDCGTHLGLRQISIFPEITNSLISTHNHHRKKYSSEQFVLLTF